MSVQIIEEYITEDQARLIISSFSKYLVQSDRIGMAEAQYEDPDKALFNIYGGKPIIDDADSLEAATLFTNAVNGIADKISEFYDVDAVPATAIFAEITEGGQNGLHCDSVMLDGTPWEDGNDQLKDLEFSALLYLNNSGVDYDGGQVEFPNQKITVTPQAGKLVFFRGDIDHPHQVFEVTAGKRYTLVLFYGRADKVEMYQRYKFEREFGGV